MISALPDSLSAPLAGSYDQLPDPEMPAPVEYSGPQGATGGNVYTGAFGTRCPVTVPPLILPLAIVSPRMVALLFSVMSPSLCVSAKLCAVDASYDPSRES